MCVMLNWSRMSRARRCDPRLLPAPLTEQPTEHRLAGLVLAGEHHVVEHRHAGEHLGELERAHHPLGGELVARRVARRLAVERDHAGVGLVEPGEQVEQRGLAGAVGADQGGDRAALHLQAVDVDGTDAAERAASRRSAARIGSGLATPGTGSTPSKAPRAGLGQSTSRLAPAPPPPAVLPKTTSPVRRHRRGVALSGGHRSQSPCGRRTRPADGRSSAA